MQLHKEYPFFLGDRVIVKDLDEGEDRFAIIDYNQEDACFVLNYYTDNHYLHRAILRKTYETDQIQDIGYEVLKLNNNVKNN